MAEGRLRKLRLGGVHEDGLFGVLPGWVDGTKAPGTTSQTSELGFGATMHNIITLRCDHTLCCDCVHALAADPPWLAGRRLYGARARLFTSSKTHWALPMQLER